MSQLPAGLELARLQDAFVNSVLSEHKEDDKFLGGPVRLLYRASILGNLRAVLEAGFPVTREFLGTAYFDAIAEKFVEDHLPTSPCLAHYGAEFPGFLSGRSELAEWPCTFDLARLEWHCKRLLVAPDPAVPCASDTARGEVKGLSLRSDCLPFASRFDVVAIVDWHQDRLSKPPELSPAVDMKSWILQREGRRILKLPINNLAFELLLAASENRLSARIDDVAARLPQQDVSACLADLIARGLLLPRF